MLNATLPISPACVSLLSSALQGWSSFQREETFCAQAKQRVPDSPQKSRCLELDLCIDSATWQNIGYRSREAAFDPKTFVTALLKLLVISLYMASTWFLKWNCDFNIANWKKKEEKSTDKAPWPDGYFSCSSGKSSRFQISRAKGTPTWGPNHWSRGGRSWSTTSR